MYTHNPHTPDGAPQRRRKRSRRKRSQELAPSGQLTGEHRLTGGRSRCELSRISESSKAAPRAYTEDADRLGREKSRGLDMSRTSAVAPRPSAPTKPRAGGDPSASVVVGDVPTRCSSRSNARASGVVVSDILTRCSLRSKASAPIGGAGSFFTMFGRHRRRPDMHTQPTPVLIHGDEHSIGGLSATPSSTSLVFDSLTGSYVETDTMHIDVSGCTDMHGYGMRTILYPYDVDKSTGRGKYLWEAAEMFILLMLQTFIELILACAPTYLHADLH